MATSNPTLFFRGAASTSSTTLYTPSVTIAVITDIMIVNADPTSTQTATITLDGVTLIPAVSLDPNSVVNFQPRQPLSTGKNLAGLASSTNVKFHIAGVEIS